MSHDASASHPGPSAGLTSAQASARLASDGANALPPSRRAVGLWLLARELVHFFAIMLWVAAALAFIGGLPQLGVAIVIVIVLNALFAFIQESRADRAAERLQALLPARIAVLRDGLRTVIDATGVVRGDVMLVSTGDRIPADGIVQVATALRVDASLLTGESEPVDISAGGSANAGTFVVEGDGEVLVTATGPGTRLAQIARLATSEPKPRSVLEDELRRVVRLIAVIAVTAGVLFGGLTIALGNPASDALIFGIGVTVALVPEALLPTVTLTLAWGAERMARRQVLVRDLRAVQTLGATTVICTDKTGTLTRNEMTVLQAWTPRGTASTAAIGYEPDALVEVAGQDEGAQAAVRDLALAAARCSDGYVTMVQGRWSAHGDPMEAALDAFARRLGWDMPGLRARQGVSARFPFDPRRRLMSVIAQDRVYAKGAPDALIPRCLDADPAAWQVVESMADQGLRVLAVAVADLAGPMPTRPEQAEVGLRLLGLLALADPPRLEARASIAACRRAGVQVVMVTGDHPSTAVSIANQVGLRAPADPVILGTDLPANEDELGAMLDAGGVVVARVSPEDKLRIAIALRQRGHVVAMTGDGVNDVPALHAANIGIAMGASGTDVAREAADLVLLDDRFDSIVAGIEQGRASYVNVRRFLTYHLTDNVAELTPFVIWALSGGSFPLALGVLQVLALDIGTDTLPAAALGAEPPAAHLLDRPPVTGRLLNRQVLRRSFGLLGPVMSALSMGAFLATLAIAGWRPGDPYPTGEVLLAASGAAFLTVVLGQMANAFACRSSTVWPGALGWTSNRLLIPAVLGGLLISLATIFIPSAGAMLGQGPPTAIGWVIALLAVPAILAVDALDKSLRRRSASGRRPGRASLAAPRPVPRRPAGARQAADPRRGRHRSAARSAHRQAGTGTGPP